MAIQHQHYYYAIAPFLLYLAFKLYARARLRLPPGPLPWPIVGNLYDIKPVRFLCFSEWAQHYGPIISFRLGSDLNVVVSSAELAREVLKEKDEKLADRGGKSRSCKDQGMGLMWSDYGPHYVKARRVCGLELLSSKRLEALRPVREDEVNAMVQSIYDHVVKIDSGGGGSSLVLRKYLGDVALNTIARLALGKRFESSELIEVVKGKGLKIEEESLAIEEHIPLLRSMLGSIKKEEASAVSRSAILRAIMDERSGKADQQYFVDALLALKDELQLTSDTIVALLLDIMTGGVDTTAVSVEWAMAELMRNPRIQKKAQAELDRVIGSSRVMTEWDFANLRYLRCIVKEALRLHPPSPLMLAHKAIAHIKVGGYDIPKGTTVHVNVWAIARDPTQWKNPLEFRPERFMEEDVDIRGHDFRLVPFGAGRRACPGTQLALNLITSILGHLLHHFNWTAPDGLMPDDIDMSDGSGIVATMKTPLQAIPVPRLPPHLYKRLPTSKDM